MADTLHAATAGVQDYQRVQILSSPTERIIGAAAADVVHLITELVDNALNYSPPTAPVLVMTTTQPGRTVDLDQRRRPRHRHRVARPDQQRPHLGRRDDARHRAPDGSARGEPARPAARDLGVPGAQRPRRQHRHGDAAALDPLVRRGARSDARARAGRRQPRLPGARAGVARPDPGRPARGARRRRGPGRGAGPDRGRDQRGHRPAAASARLVDRRDPDRHG